MKQALRQRRINGGEFNAEIFASATEVIRQPHCLNAMARALSLWVAEQICAA
jgi:hypothetical protein